MWETGLSITILRLGTLLNTKRIPRCASRKRFHLLQFDVGVIPNHPETARCRAAPTPDDGLAGMKETHEVQESRSGSPGLSGVSWSRFWSNFVQQQLYRWLSVRARLAVQPDLRLQRKQSDR